jgi:hypothetical protein
MHAANIPEDVTLLSNFVVYLLIWLLNGSIAKKRFGDKLYYIGLVLLSYDDIIKAKGRNLRSNI